MKYFLTFDGAPHTPYTERILDVLSKEKIHATFFLEGHRIKGNEDLLGRIIEEGHGLGNHTYSHEVLTDMEIHEAIRDVERCEREILRACNRRARAFRPPWGKISAEVAEELTRRGFVMCCWNVSVKDFEAPSAEVLADRLCDCAFDYGVVVLHDHVPIVPDALELAIPRLKELGASFERIEDYLP